jgi:flagellar biosynthesis/type III secretory pathway protein FliH
MSLRWWITGGEASSDQRAIMVEASRCVEQVTPAQQEGSEKGQQEGSEKGQQEGSEKGRKRKFSERHHYDKSTRTAIGKYALIRK